MHQVTYSLQGVGPFLGDLPKGRDPSRRARFRRTAGSFRRGPLWIGLSAALLFLTGPHAARAETPCLPSAPESVVICLAEAFNQRDVKTLDTLFSPDFVYVQGEEILDRATQLKSYEKMFKSPQVKGIAFSVEGVSSQPTEDTWLVTVAATRLVVSFEREGKRQDITVHSSNYRFSVRRAADTYQIFRWEEPSSSP